MKDAATTPESVANEIFQTLRDHPKKRGMDFEKRCVAEFIFHCLPRSYVLEWHHALGFSIGDFALNKGMSKFAAQKLYDVKLEQATGILRRYGWIKISRGKWVFDPDALESVESDAAEERIPHEYPPLPQDNAEACVLFGIEPAMPASVKLKAVAEVAKMFARATELVLSETDN